jgi:AraC-like DNA-binding protein
MEKFPAVSLTIINSLFTLLEKQKINSSQFLINEGFDPSILKNPDSIISIQDTYHLIHKAAEITGDTHIGLHMGELFTGLANIVGSVLINCQNLGEAFNACQRYQSLFDQTRNSKIIVKDGIATITFSIIIDFYDQDRILSEFRGSTAYNSIGQMIEKDIILREIHFRHKKPQNISEYQRIFKCPVRFSSDLNAVMFDSEYLALPLKQPNPQLCTIFNNYAQQMLKRLEGNELFSDKVKKILINSMVNKIPGIKHVAQQMAVSVRKLQLKLKEEGTSFSNIIDKTREELAIQYLQEKNITINEVAFLLGFSEPSAFHRSFKRWKGISPGEFRKNFDLPGNS